MYKIVGPYCACSLSKLIVNVQNPPSQYTGPMHRNWLVLEYVVRHNVSKLCAEFQNDPPSAWKAAISDFFPVPLPPQVQPLPCIQFTPF